jgi:hypothetical protein
MTRFGAGSEESEKSGVGGDKDAGAWGVWEERESGNQA